jgi:F420-nonreducing hydrogenase I large subunit
MRIIIDPVTRLSGGLRVSVELKDGSVVNASASGMTYRGFEQMLLKKEPADAVYFTQRICGMCSASHATASAGAIESVAGATHLVPKDALVIRNMLNGLGFLKNHVEHLYMGFLPDMADTTYMQALRSSDLGTTLWDELEKRYTAVSGDAYKDALRCIKLIGRAEGILGGRSPGSPVIVPGGVTTAPAQGDVYALKDCLEGIDTFLQSRLLGGLAIDAWLENTHDAGGYAIKYLESLSMSDLSPEKGWGDLPLFMMFCSRRLAKDRLTLPAFIGLDTVGGYPQDDQLIGFLSYGAFYRTRDDARVQKDGYTPLDEDGAGSYVMPGGFTPGSVQNLNAAADHLDANLIVEHVASSFYDYSEARSSESPLNGETLPEEKASAIGFDGVRYSFIKAPRYGRVPCEVGPLARLINGREKLIMDVISQLLERDANSSAVYPAASVYTRMLARMQECLMLSRMLHGWLEDDLEPGGSGHKYCVPVAVKPGKAGAGLIEAPRGALGHWLKVDSEGKIANYQVVAPTTWNASPKCSELKNGPMELALLGSQTTPSGYLPGSEANPVGIYHVIRSFDPCVSCAVHTVRRRGRG